MASNELEENSFRQMWTTVSTALRRLGTPEPELERYKQIDLDPETTRLCIYEVKQQAMIDLCSHLEVKMRFTKHTHYVVNKGYLHNDY